VVNLVGVVVPMVGRKMSTPFNSCFTFSSSDKYFHTWCIILDVMMKCLCLLFSLSVFDQLLEMLFDSCKLLYLCDLGLISV
jgi:hypothetical protein